MNYYNYFTEIEETFVRRRGKNLLLSPLDWALIETWQERKVPLHIVIRAIETVFDTWDKQPHRRRSVKSLAYCREEIEAQFDEWLETRVGSESEETAELPEDDVLTHLLSAKDEISALADRTSDAAFRETLGRVAERLNELLERREDPEKLERSLDTLDEMIVNRLIESEAANSARSEVEAMFASSRKTMDEESYKRVFDLMLRKRLRETAGVPRLSLFHL